VVQVQSLEEPVVTIRNLLVAQWDPANTVLAAAPSISTGWWDRSNVRPQVTVSPLPDLPADGTETGYTSTQGDGSGPNQRVVGEVQVDCWAVRAADGDPNPKTVVWDLSREVKRIAAAAFAGTGALDFVGFEDAGRDVDTTASPVVFRRTVMVTYGYLLTP